MFLYSYKNPCIYLFIIYIFFANSEEEGKPSNLLWDEKSY